MGATKSNAAPMGTCQICDRRVAWTTSTLARHPAPEGADPADPAVVLYRRTGGSAGKEPARPDSLGRYVCAGSYKPPTEATGASRQNDADEREALG